MRKIILSGLSAVLLLFLLLYTPGCSPLRRKEPLRPLYGIALEMIREERREEAAELLASVTTREQVYPAALIRGLELTAETDHPLYALFLSRLSAILPSYPYLDDYYYFSLMRQKYHQKEYAYLREYQAYFDLVQEEDLYKELLFYHLEALLALGEEEDALKQAVDLYGRRLQKKRNEALQEILSSLLLDKGIALRGKEWRMLPRIPLPVSKVKKYLSAHQEESRFWWDTASRFFSKKELTALGGDKNGYVLAKSLAINPSSPEDSERLAELITDPGLSYPSPLAVLFLSHFPADHRGPFFFTLIDPDQREHSSIAVFRALLEKREYSVLEEWLDFWTDNDFDSFASTHAARCLFWKSYLLFQRQGLSPAVEEGLTAAARKAPLSYYHSKASELLNLPLLHPRLFLSSPRQKTTSDKKMESLLEALGDYRDHDGIHMIQLSLDNHHFMNHLPLFMDHYRKQQNYSWMIMSSRYLWNTEGPSRELIPYLYPAGYKDEIRSFSVLETASSPLVFAVIHQESRFIPRATSRAGAMGLMQLMPGTFKGLKKHILNASPEMDAYDIRANITAGTAYLGNLLDRFDEKEYALAAYNAGPHRVQRWLEEFGARPPEEFAELIPYYETRAYVFRVLAMEAIYRECIL